MAQHTLDGLRSFVSASNDFAFLTDLGLKIKCASSVAEELLSCGKNKLTDCQLGELIFQSHQERFTKWIANNCELPEDFPLLTKTAGERWVKLSRSFVDPANGLVIFMGLLIPNPGDRELELIEKEGALRDAEEIGKMGNWWVDVKTMKNHWSKGNYKIWDCDPSKPPPPVDWVMSKLFKEDAENVSKAMRKVAKSGHPTSLVYRRKDCDKQYLTRIRPWYINGELREVKGVNFEITEVLQAQTELEKINASLLKKNRILKRYGYLNSHEIRGPLSSILGLIELFKVEDLEKEEMIALLDKAGKQIDDAIKKANELLYS